MLHNSFKFLTLALAASLTVAPVSAIDWNSNSSRFGLGLAFVSLVSVMVYNYFYKSAPKQEQNNVANNSNNNEQVATTELPKKPIIRGKFVQQTVALHEKYITDANKQ